MAGRKKALDEATEAVVCREYQDGRSTGEIAASHGVAQSTIALTLRRHGVPIRPYRRSPETKDEACRLYQEGVSIGEIEDRLGFSRTLLFQEITRRGIPLRGHCAVADDQRESVCSEYLDGASQLDLGQKYGVTVSTIGRWLRERGIPVRSMSEALRTCTLNEHAFDVETEESKYWIGFLMADGCVTVGTRGQVYIQLAQSIQDESHVIAFRDFLGSNHKLDYQSGKGFANAKPTVKLSIASRHIADRLAAYGIVPRKSKTARVVGLEMDRHFWRGVVDGDGWVKIDKGGYPKIGLVGSEAIIGQFRDFFKMVCPKSKASINPVHSIFSLCVTRHQARRLVRTLYEGCTIALPRKWGTARAILAADDDRPLFD